MGTGGIAGPDAQADGNAADGSSTDMASDMASTDAAPDAAIDQAPDQAVDHKPGAANGTACTTGSECDSTFCTDNVCCDKACTGACVTCSATPGTCLPASVGTDPRNMCTDNGKSTCGTDGVCDGAGACRKYAAGESCGTSPMCNSTNSIVLLNPMCDGVGACASGPTQDCKGFACVNATCKTSCTNDTTCATTHFCSAGTCVPKIGNLAGNGDLEYGTTAGWYGVFGGGGTLQVSDTMASGYAHGGRYSAQNVGRTQIYHGPAYRLPTGPGKYTISGWGFQKDDASLGGTLQVSTICATTVQYLPGVSGVLSQGAWTQYTLTVDTSAGATPAGDCTSAGGAAGVVKLARVFINQSATGTPLATPDLFLDDIVVQVTDGHNLVGNPNFEAGFTDGWTVSGGNLSISNTQFKTGARSLSVSGRTATTAGPSYAMPIGAAKYNIVFQGMHMGTSSHSLVLQSAYTCLGGTTTVPATPIVTTASLPGGTWTQLSGTVALPPADAPAGCKLTDAVVYMQQAETGTCVTSGGALECPDLYVDDISITLVQ
jgi:hypothetical protein